MSIIKDTFFGGSEKKAAETQAKSGREAIASQERTLERIRGDLAPFRGVGERAINPIMSLVSGPIDDSVERENIISEVSNTAAARGKLRSGGTLKELSRQLFGLQQRNRSQRFNELFNILTLGSNAASGQATATLATGRDVANTITGIGNAQAAGRIGQGNAIRNTVFQTIPFIPGVA